MLNRRQFLQSTGALFGSAVIADLESKIDRFASLIYPTQEWEFVFDESVVKSAISIDSTEIIDGRFVCNVSCDSRKMWDAVALRNVDTGDEWKTHNGEHWYPVGDDVQWCGFPPEEMVIWNR